VQRFSNYKEYIISTTVRAVDGKPFGASFVIVSWKTAGAEEKVGYAERLGGTFAYSADARAAANRAAQTHVDNLTPPAR
jgi:hypothetical protein